MTSTWTRSQPASQMALTSRSRLPKSAESTLGATNILDYFVFCNFSEIFLLITLYLFTIKIKSLSIYLLSSVFALHRYNAQLKKLRKDTLWQENVQSVVKAQWLEIMYLTQKTELNVVFCQTLEQYVLH